jgi:superoxide dismutase, Fe-Mn family
MKSMPSAGLGHPVVLWLFMAAILLQLDGEWEHDMEPLLTRRTLISGASVLGAGIGLSASSTATAVAGNVPLAGAKAYLGNHQPQPLPFDPAKLDGLSAKLLQSHWENNYQGAINALNTIELKIPGVVADQGWPAYLLGDVKREELLRTGSVIMHQLYFGNLGGDGRTSGDIGKSLVEWFGSRMAWETEFRKVALGLAGGSGWAILSLNLYTGALHNRWAWDHHTSVAGEMPLLVCDMYEHAYALDYGAAAPAYVDAFMRNVNWIEVDRRFAIATKAARLLS